MSYRLPPPERKSDYVREKFDQIAHSYDLFNDLITQFQHRRWKRVLVERLEISPDAFGLDLCCGTGDIAARCLARLSPRGELAAVDFSPGMLEIARSRLSATRERGGTDAPRPLLLGGDAMRLPFRDASFHFIAIGYGLRNVSSLEGCLEELWRVLRPEGVLASLDVGKVRNPLLRRCSDFYMFRVVPLIGGLLQRGQDMYQYLPHSTVEYPDQDSLRVLMEGKGFTRVETIEFLFGASVIHLARKPG
jgi:demethylmenaquinone methyltransferase/2-methoxy-6-polyprenyl-1,4-benzoquinol methylase